MELTQLHYFTAVAHSQHLTKAAESLCISQPALSKAISRLEEELGVELFDRSSNRIALNSNGELYLRYVERALLELDSGREAVRSHSGTVSGNVSIMTSCSGLLQPAIREFLTVHRGIRYQQYRYTSDLIAEQLEQGSADFALTTTPLTSVKFSWTQLVQDELYVTVAPAHPFYGRESISIQELRDQPLIVSNNLLSMHGVVVDGFAQFGMTPRIDYELNNPPLTEQLIEECRGVSFVPGLKADQLPVGSIQPRQLIAVTEHPFTYEVGILKLRSHFQSPAAALLEHFLLDWFAAPDNWVRTSREVRVI